jgi:hypothetical protein
MGSFAMQLALSVAMPVSQSTVRLSVSVPPKKPEHATLSGDKADDEKPEVVETIGDDPVGSEGGEIVGPLHTTAQPKAGLSASAPGGTI